MSVIHTITTLWRSDPSPIVDSFGRASRGVKQFSQDGRKALNDFQNAANSLKIKDNDMERQLKNVFGKGSKLDFGVDLLTGGGALVALREAVNTFGEFKNKLGELSAKWDENTSKMQKFRDGLAAFEDSVAPAKWGGSAGTWVNNLFTGKQTAAEKLSASEERLKPLREDFKKFMDGNVSRVAILNKQVLDAAHETIERQITADQRKRLARLSGSGLESLRLMFGRDNDVRRVFGETRELDAQLRAKRSEIMDSQRYRFSITEDRAKAELISDQRQKRVALNEVNEKSQLLEGKIKALEQEAQAIEGLIAAKRVGQNAEVAALNSEFREKSRALWNGFITDQSKALQDLITRWTGKGIVRAFLEGPKPKEQDPRVAELAGGWFSAAYRPYQRDEDDVGRNVKSLISVTQSANDKLLEAIQGLANKLTFTPKSL